MLDDPNLHLEYTLQHTYYYCLNVKQLHGGSSAKLPTSIISVTCKSRIDTLYLPLVPALFCAHKYNSNKANGISH